MTTKISKILTILVTVLSLSFLGATAVSSIARTNWKEKAAEFPEKKAQELQTEITGLNQERDNYTALIGQTSKTIEIDQAAMLARETNLQQYAKTLETEDRKLREQNSTESQSAQEKLDVDKMRREEIQRLQAQYEELVSQREAAQSEVKRLRDLLYQERGVLQRAQRRQQSLQTALGQPVSEPYDPSADLIRAPGRSATPPARQPLPAKAQPGDALEDTPSDTADDPADDATATEADPSADGEMPAEEEMPAAEETTEEPGEDVPDDAEAAADDVPADEAAETPEN